MTDHLLEVSLPPDGPWTHTGCRLVDELLEREHRADALAIAREGLGAAEFAMSVTPDPLTSERHPDVERIRTRQRLRCELEIGLRLRDYCVAAARGSAQLPGELACYSLALVNWRQVGGAWLRRITEGAADAAETQGEKT